MINWEQVLPEVEDVNIIFDSFYAKISENTDKHAPMEKSFKSQKYTFDKPLITKALKVSIARKNKLYKSYSRNRSEYFHMKHKLYRNKLRHLLNICKKSYNNNYVHTNSGNMKEGYKRISYF